MEYNNVYKSIMQTHAITHNKYKLDVLNIFEINRIKKYKFKPFKKQIKNCKLLFHGTRLSNFASILSQGLKIAPPYCYKCKILQTQI